MENIKNPNEFKGIELSYAFNALNPEASKDLFEKWESEMINKEYQILKGWWNEINELCPLEDIQKMVMRLIDTDKRCCTRCIYNNPVSRYCLPCMGIIPSDNMIDYKCFDGVLRWFMNALPVNSSTKALLEDINDELVYFHTLAKTKYGEEFLTNSGLADDLHDFIERADHTVSNIFKCVKCGGSAHISNGSYPETGEYGFWVECDQYHEYTMHGMKDNCNNISNCCLYEEQAIAEWNKANQLYHKAVR